MIPEQRQISVRKENRALIDFIQTCLYTVDSKGKM